MFALQEKSSRIGGGGGAGLVFFFFLDVFLTLFFLRTAVVCYGAFVYEIVAWGEELGDKSRLVVAEHLACVTAACSIVYICSTGHTCGVPFYFLFCFSLNFGVRKLEPRTAVHP